VRKLDWVSWPAPLLLVAFAAIGVQGVNAIFTDSVRWAVLAAALLLAGSQGFPRPLYSSAFMLGSLALSGWAAASTMWSEWPQLSALKSAAFAAVVVGGTGAGFLWVRRHPIPAALDVLIPLLALALAAGLAGQSSSAFVDMTEGITLYQGGTGNPNFLGALCVMALPLPAWKFLVSTSSFRRVGWALCLAATLLLIVLSRSRAALLVVFFVGVGAAGVMGWRRAIPVATLGIAAFVTLMLAIPEPGGAITADLVYKGNRDAGVLASRQQIWEDTFNAALQGGMWGAGYGVSVGSETVSSSMTTAVGYAREKGNSQLGIVEELGVIGLLLYLLATIALFGLLLRAVRYSQNVDSAAMCKLLTGTLVGMTAHSAFEAWYTSPGSMECVYYWVMAGVAVGLATDARTRNPAHSGGEAPGALPVQGRPA